MRSFQTMRVKTKNRINKIIASVMVFCNVLVFHGEIPVYADKETGIKNAIDDAVTGEMIGLCNQLGLTSVEKGEWPAERPASTHWLEGKGIAKKYAPQWWRFKKPGEPPSHYDVDLTYGSFFSQPWPYDLQYKGKDGKRHPTVGDVCAALGVPQVEEFAAHGGTADPAYGGREYNDVNFAEILSILAQGDKGNWREVEYEDFNEYIRDEKAQCLYYEIDFTWWMYYEWEEHVTQTNSDGETETVTIIHGKHINCGHNKAGEKKAQGMPAYLGSEPWLKTKYYAQVKLKPMGLRNLYILADVYPSEKNKDFIYHTNSEILDHQEDYTKTYMRKDRTLNPIFYDEKRSKRSSIYQDLVDYYGKAKGRSAPWYIEDPYNLTANNIEYKEYNEVFLQQENQVQGWDIEWNGDVNEAQAKLRALAEDAIGRIPYYFGGHDALPGFEGNNFWSTVSPDHKNRTQKGLDCSGYVQWLYKTALGVDYKYNTTASYSGMQMSTDHSSLKPGMLGFKYSPGSKDNHVGMYLGKDSNGKDLWAHCSSSKGSTINSYSGFKYYCNPLGF